MFSSIVLEGKFLKVKNVDQRLSMKDIKQYNLLEGDIVEYKVSGDTLSITKLLHRDKQTIGIYLYSTEKHHVFYCYMLSGVNNVYMNVSIEDYTILNEQKDDISTHKNRFYLLHSTHDKTSIVDLLTDVDATKLDTITYNSIFIEKYYTYSGISKIDDTVKKSLETLYDKITSSNTDKDTTDIKDLTHLNTITLDPELSTDIDDALSYDEKNNILYIHISDFMLTKEEFVKAGCLGTTLYLPNKTFHMLDNIEGYSLLQGKKRYVITIELVLDEDFSIKSSCLYPSYIIVKKNMSYDMFDIEKEESLYKFYIKNKHDTDLYNINKHYHRKIYVDTSGDTKDMNTSMNKVSIHNLREKYKFETTDFIATCMIIVNGIVSEYMKCNSLKFIYRTNTHPLNITSEETEKKHHTRYTTTSDKHERLSMLCYTHFTSPIRRFNDVVCHMLYNKTIEYTITTDIQNVIQYINSRSEHIKSVYKLFETFLVNEYIIQNTQKHMNRFNQTSDDHKKLFKATILSITKNGLLVFIDEILHTTFISIKHVQHRNIKEWKYDYSKCIYKHGKYSINMHTQIVVEQTNGYMMFRVV